MNIFRFSLAAFLITLLLFPVSKAFAHGGGHKAEEKKIEEPMVTDSMYSVQDQEDDALSDSDNNLDNLFSPTDLFTQDELVEPTPIEDEKMEGSHNEHKMPQVQLAHHERVSSSSKGYGAAVGITLFAGIAFAGLTFMRPGE
ncbi:MAG: hypothetical protein F3740_11020 [Nitrospinae bacterium]|nr:hypothetical protein [Nitrospinota bacterium]